MRKLPFDKAKLEEIAAKWPTPFHIYDAKAIRENARRLKKAFAWNAGFREYFAVKAAPNPYLMKLLKEFGVACVPGTAFGACGAGFVRMSYATSLDKIKLAASRIAKMLKSIS